MALVPEGEEKLVNRVGRAAIETINRLAPGDKKYLAASISDAFEDIRWRSGDDMPDYLEHRIVRVMQLAEKSKDQFSFEKAIE